MQLVFRERSDLAEDLGKTDATFTLNFSTGSAMVLAQYYNFVRFGHEGYRYITETMQANARSLARRQHGVARTAVPERAAMRNARISTELSSVSHVNGGDQRADWAGKAAQGASSPSLAHASACSRSRFGNSFSSPGIDQPAS